MCGKKSLTKFANYIFYIIVLRAEYIVVILLYYCFPHVIQNRKAIFFCILLHFATKFWNFTTFERLLPGFAKVKKLVYNVNCPFAIQGALRKKYFYTYTRTHVTRAWTM